MSKKRNQKYFRGTEEDYLKRQIRLHPRHVVIPEGCWMCGVKGVDMSDEHIFPIWLLDKLNCKNQLYYSTHAEFTGRIIDRRKIPLGNFVCGRICRSHCNEGWMGELEKEVKGVYDSGWRKGINKNQTLLARWLAKTATTLNASQQFRVMVPALARHGLINREVLPEGWLIYVFDCKTREPAINWLQGGSVIATNTSRGDSKTAGQIFRCALKLGGFGGMVFL